MSSPMWRPLRRHSPPSGRSRGQSIVELALILPIFLLLIAGAVDLGRLFYAYVAIVNASKEGALFGAANPQCGTGAECGDPMNVVWHVRSEAGGLKDASGRPLTPTIACLGPGALARSGLSNCQDGDTYRVGLSYDFRLITPILGSLLEHRLMLHTEADSTVLNQAYNPIPGISVTKTVWDPEEGEWVRTPTVNATTGVPSNLEFQVTDTVRYRVTLTNTGGTNLSGIAIVDDAVQRWPPSGCLNISTLGIGSKPYVCTYQVGPLAKAEKDRQNTVTVTAGALSPVVDVAVIDVLASPPRLEIAKEVRVYRHAQGSSWAQDLTVHQSSTVAPTVWYRLRVTNTGGSPATGFSIRDSVGQLPSSADCPPPDKSLDPGETYVCFYPRTFSQSGTHPNTLTVHSKETGDDRDSASVRVQTCQGSERVVPNLVEDPSGDARSVAEARTLWTGAGFTGGFSPATGADSRDVTSQNRDPYDCESATTSVTVGHK
jgi:hypothetical protein